MSPETIVDDLAALFRARCTLVWVVSREECRAERGIIEAAAKAKYDTRLWDCACGLQDANGAVLDAGLANPIALMNGIRKSQDRAVFILRDLHKWLDAVILRWLRTLARELQVTSPDDARTIVVLSPSSEIPPELAGHAIVLDYPLPQRAEIGTILDDILETQPEEKRESLAPNGVREQAIDAAVGLSAEEASNCYARSLVTRQRIDPQVVSAEKKRVIARERVLTWHEPDPRGMDAIGGLELLKRWLVQRKVALGQKARAYGLPAPKGVLLVGVPGCGKSLTAKAVASAWEIPLLRMDMGALRGKYVGESEANIRKALATAEAVAPCVLWVDEIEKALAGATGAQGDGGVSADALGAVLSWMQERTASVFVVATANDVSALPPEMLRKGRFDELFFVDLPTAAERAAVLEATLRQYGREPEALGDLGALVSDTSDWSGAEIAALVPEALFASFADGARELERADLEHAARAVVPMAKTASDRIAGLRKWAEGRARPASVTDTERGRGVRAIEL